MRAFPLLLLASALLAACDDPERTRLESLLTEHEQTRQLLVSQLNASQGRVQSLDGRASQVEEEIRAHDNQVEAYIMDHKGAVVCMGAAGYALTDSNEYEQEVKDLAVLTGLVCAGIALFNPDFASEAATVFDYLMQADTRAKALKSQLGSLQLEAAEARRTAAGDQVRLDSLTATIHDLQLQLGGS